MTCGNPIKHKFLNAFNSFIDAFSFERKLRLPNGMYAVWYM